jgi:hypothetical protein
VEEDKHQVSLTRLEVLFTSQVVELLEEGMEEVRTMEAIMEEVRTELEPPETGISNLKNPLDQVKYLRSFIIYDLKTLVNVKTCFYHSKHLQICILN